MKEPVNPRQFALDVIGRLPERVSVEDLRENFEIILGILESYRDVEEGRVFTHAQIMAELQEWISQSTGRAQPAAT